MRKIYLPTLKKIRIQNFSLYPKGLDFEYKFVNGVNLIMGGNGMGKTTLVNLIKYAIIGHYKKAYGLTRIYMGKKIEKRLLYPVNYYKNRQDKSVNLEGIPTVTIEFKVNEDYYIVERELVNITLKSVIVNNKKLTGKIVSTERYEQLDDAERKQYINFAYEEKISQSSKILFDELIFFVNEILFFGENHKTILWGNGETDVQTELFNKYFNEPDLDLERQEANQQAKYFDSLSRHTSEDMRAIRKVLDDVAGNSEYAKESISTKILSLKSEIEKIDKDIESRLNVRSLTDDRIRQLNNDINTYTQQESEIEKMKKIAEHSKLSEQWQDLHKRYDSYFQSIKVNSLCPMCNQDLDGDFVNEKVANPKSCFVCEQELPRQDFDIVDEQIEKISNQLIENYNKIKNTQQRIDEEEKSISELDKEFRNLSSEKRELQSRLRKLEHQSQKNEPTKNELQPFYDELERLQKLKEEYQEQSKQEKVKAAKITNLIGEVIEENTLKFSSLFAEFAGSFLGVRCGLTFTSISEQAEKRFYPIINGSIRYDEEELSESQRFFVDHSFRMSILSFFYNKPAFFIVETPNSSLDISYERNAANVFAKFLEKPNVLIITTNLNNSEFLEHLIESASKVSYINLLTIGRQSEIQSVSKSMKTISTEIENKINNER